jgi:hypothetical protein
MFIHRSKEVKNISGWDLQLPKNNAKPTKNSQLHKCKRAKRQTNFLLGDFEDNLNTVYYSVHK